MSTLEGHDPEDQGIRVRRGRRAPFKQLPDDAIDDETISPEAKVVYWYLKRIADYDDANAIVSMGRIAHKLGRARTNRRAARTWVKELSDAGWVDTQQRKSSSGSDLATEFIVHDIRAHPASGERWTPGGGGLRIKGEGINPDPGRGVAAEPGGRGSTLTQGGGQPRTGEGVAAEPLSSRRFSLLDVSSSKNKPSSDAAASTVTDPPKTDLFGATPAAVPAGVQPHTNGHVRTGAGQGVAPPSEGDSRATTAGSTPAVSPGPSRAELAAVHAALFEEFWTTYAHKVGKGAARKAWTVACRKADPREVINATARYASSRRGEDPRFTPHASTWLNGERWLDEPEYVRNGQGPARDGHRNGHVAYQNPPESAYVRTTPRHHTSDQQGVQR